MMVSQRDAWCDRNVIKIVLFFLENTRVFCKKAEKLYIFIHFIWRIRISIANRLKSGSAMPRLYAFTTNGDINDKLAQLLALSDP